MKRNISFRIYDTSLFALGILIIFNIIGLWVTWTHPNNPLGYVAGSLVIATLIAEGFLSFCNEKVSVRKHMILWAIFLALHLVFFIIIAVQVNKYGVSNYIGPALFTVLLVGMLATSTYFIVRRRVVNKNKPYTIVTPTSVDDNVAPTDVQAGEIVSPTVKIKVDQEVDNTPAQFIQPEEKVEDKPVEVKPIEDNPVEVKPIEDKPEEDKPKAETDVITL